MSDIDKILAGITLRADAARELGRSERTLRRWERQKRIPVIAIGNFRGYETSTLRRVLAGEHEPPEARRPGRPRKA